MTKRIMTILLSGLILFGVLSLGACNSGTDSSSGSTADSSATLIKGYYTHSSDRTGNLLCFYKFKEDGTYYGKFFNGGIKDAGTWKLLDKEMEYYSGPGPDNDWFTEDDNAKSTAKQVVEVTSYKDGSVVDIAYDNDKLCDTVLGGMAGHITMDHNADFVYVAKDEEDAIAIQTLYYNNDSGSTLTLYHDKTFSDYLNMGIEGTWEKDGNKFTLTSDSKTYTLTVSANGHEATYVKDGATLELKSYVSTGEVKYTFESEDGKVALDCVDDFTCELYVDNKIVDTGTYDVNSVTYAFKFKLNKGGEFSSEMITDETDTEKGTPARIKFSIDGVEYVLNLWVKV